MKIIDQTTIWRNLIIDLKEFPELLKAFARANPATPVIEQMGARLAEQNFAPAKLKEFIQAVCRWGGYTGIGARIIQNNEEGELTSRFGQAYKMVADGGVVEALAILLQVNSLGISFASKHLKFLAPSDAVVLDSIIEEQLGYATNPAGYGAFLTDCRDILDACKEHEIPYPIALTKWNAQEWRISDIEMAIFAKLTPAEKSANSC
jgi:hypothetical protein